jgi:hypothetical protein
VALVKPLHLPLLLTVVLGNVDESDPNPPTLLRIRVKLIQFLIRDRDQQRLFDHQCPSTSAAPPGVETTQTSHLSVVIFLPNIQQRQ